jgi:hypothetical protein
MPELELALADLGRHIEFPPSPELAPRVRERLAERPESRPGLTRRRGMALAFALLAVAVAAALAVPQTRAAILEFFHLRGVTIGEKVSLDEARDRADFEIVVPEALGDPDGVYFQETPPGGMVSLVYGTPEHPRALFTQFRGSVEEVIFKKTAAGTQIDSVRVRGEPGYFLSGNPHEFSYFDRRGEYRQEIVRLAGNTLLWERGPLTLRLEADINKEEALKIARSAD